MGRYGTSWEWGEETALWGAVGWGGALWGGGEGLYGALWGGVMRYGAVVRGSTGW